MANYENLGYIIAQHKKIENSLRHLLDGRITVHDSMNELISLAKSLRLIDEELVQNLHQIKSIRNKAAHENNHITDEEINDFNSLYEKIIKELTVLESRKNKMGDFIENEKLRAQIKKKDDRISEILDNEKLLKKELEEMNEQLKESQKSYYERSPKLQRGVKAAGIIGAVIIGLLSNK